MKERDERMKLPRLATPHESPAQRFRHEADTWCRLDHRHVLPFFGLCVDGPTLYMCSPWQDRGDLPHYLRERPDVDRLVLVSAIICKLAYDRAGVVR